MATEPKKQGPVTEILAKAALKWLAGRVAFLQKFKYIPGAIKPSNWESTKLFQMGELFLFHYDPKYKNDSRVLPYYDTFPLVIPLHMYNDGFLGLNLHYLPPKMRASFFNKLLQYVKADVGSDRLRMQISYGIIKDANSLKAYIPCIKRYLINHVEGRILKIQPHEWPLVLNLPIANFQKATESYVWNDSRRKINAAG